MRRKHFSIGLTAAVVVTLTMLGTDSRAAAQTEIVLYSFGASSTDAQYPYYGSLVVGASGSFYGTTLYGGTYGAGTVFKLAPAAGGGWTESILHSFNDNGKDGYLPLAGLVIDASGNLYGTTLGGVEIGTYGTVFELSPRAGGGWTEKIVHSFGSGANQYGLVGGVILDASGNLYGTTEGGGVDGDGTVFELSPKVGGGWSNKFLHSFNGTDGTTPLSSLTFDSSGNLYGTTPDGGTGAYGTVFELVPKVGGSWTRKTLFNFQTNNGARGLGPEDGVILDAAGNIYGATRYGGAFGYGTVFELEARPGGSWAEKVLYSFNNNSVDGYYPYAGLVSDAAGNLYGTTISGGVYGDGRYSGGTVFKLTRVGGIWAEQVLHSFGSGTDGNNLQGGLVLDAAGNLYGTTTGGGTYGYGTVFEITP